MTKLILSLILSVTLFASKDIKPSKIYSASGGVTDIVSYDGKLYVATAASCVDIIDIKTKKILNSIKIPQIKDFMGDTIDAKVYSVDVYNGMVLLTSEAPKGIRELHIYKDGKLKTLIDTSKGLIIGKAKFVDDNTVVFDTLGNEMYLYDIAKDKFIWKIDVKAVDATFNSTFADFSLNEKRDIAVVADESGDLKVVDIKKAQVIKLLAGKNLDKVFKVDFKNNKVITAGQDGRCVVYNLKNNSSYALREKHWFLIYGAGLSPSGKLGAYSSDENNNVTVFNTDTRSKLYRLTQNNMTLTGILFTSEDEVFVITDSDKFNFYKLK